MKPRRKRVILRAMAVLVIVLGVTVLAFLEPADPREAKARRLIADLRGPGALRKWLIRLGVVQPCEQRDRSEIVGQLVALGRHAVPACVEGLEGGDYLVRVYAAEALGEMGPDAKAAVPALAAALEDTDHYVRYGAAEGLGKIGPAAKEAVPALIDALKSGGWYLRGCAASALGKIGPAAKAAVPALKEALNDKEEDVREAAAEALEKIQAAPATREAATREATTTQPGVSKRGQAPPSRRAGTAEPVPMSGPRRLPPKP